ncbi:MAG: transposase [Thermodesulfovibrionia bacterium]|nr:transposase [Thermodesulfovibrionia bacterium]
MKENTKKRKKAIRGIEEACGRQEIIEQMYAIYAKGKAGFDVYMKEMGRLIAETIMYIEREEMAGPDYQPFSPDIYKWASQPGSVYIGDQKIMVQHPRLRGTEGEIALKSYEKLKEREMFSEELLNKILRGISCRKYAETVVDVAGAFGVSASSVSRHIVEATAKQLREFKERSLLEYKPFAIFLDTIHRGGEAFIIGLGINTEGIKKVLGFWQGATENHDICEELFGDMERRGMALTREIIWITDGGKGVIKALRKRFGKKLIHQRCTIHKDKNIQRHLAKKYRKEAHRRFRMALEHNSYEDARQMLLDMEKWLRSINESAADSLMEAIEEILTVHKLKVPGLLRKTLHSTNPIESMFSIVRDAEGNIKRYRNSRMMQRWLASVLLYSEKRFRRIKGYASIPGVIRNIEIENKNDKIDRKAA